MSDEEPIPGEEIPPHILDGLSAEQKKAFGKSALTPSKRTRGKRGAKKAATKRGAKKGSKSASLASGYLSESGRSETKP